MKKSSKEIDLFKEEHVLVLYSVLLGIGSWKNAFTPYQLRVMIAEALNDCVYHHHLKLAGYLVSNRKLCLVIENDKGDLDELLLIFYDRLRKEIRKARERLDVHEAAPHEGLLPATNGLFHPVPTPYAFMNDCLVKLVTGREVNLPYYNPHLHRLSNCVSSAGFCSAIDYSGAKGPVKVNVLHYKPGLHIKDVRFEI